MEEKYIQIQNKKIFALGAIPDPPDERDYHLSEVLKAYPPFDWEKGYDVEQEIGDKILIKNQGMAGSCTGEAFSYYAAVLEALEIKKYRDDSARWLYSQTYLPDGGSYLRLPAKILTTQGIVPTVLFPDYKTEKEMRVFDPTPDLPQIAKVYLKSNYLTLPLDKIDVLASIMQIYHGFVAGVRDDFSKGWHTAFPELGPKENYAHALFFGRAKLINGKKYIGFPNSWGTDIGDNGWQWFGEEWIPRMFNPRVLADLPDTVERELKPHYQFQKNISYGDNSTDVSHLKECLASIGMFPKGVDFTPLYGGLLLKGVQMFKLKYKNEISKIVGYEIRGTSFVGRGTRTMLNQLFK